jgi:protein SCO1/2
MFRVLIFLLFFALTLSSPVEGKVPTYTKSDFDPSIMKIDEDEFLGRTVPDFEFVDQNGRRRRLTDLSGKPLIVSIIYYSCQHSCKPLNEGLAEALSRIPLKLGRDFNVLTLSFNKYDLPENARNFRENLRIKMSSENSLPEGFENWIFATAKWEEIKKFTDAVGYRFFYLKQDQLYVHPNVYIFLSPDRVITRYIHGLFPVESDIKLAVLEASEGKVGKFPILNAALLACYRYDSTEGRYRVDPTLIFGGAGIVMGVFTVSIVVVYSRKVNRKKREQKTDSL